MIFQDIIARPIHPHRTPGGVVGFGARDRATGVLVHFIDKFGGDLLIAAEQRLMVLSAHSITI